MSKNVRIESKLKAIMAQNPAMVDEVLRTAGAGMLGDILLSFNTSPGGREYVRGGVVHVASVEGYPPNVDTGALRASMTVQKQGEGEYWIQDGVEYGLYLEEGTENMGARPFVAPVFDDWRKAKFGAVVADVARRRGLL